MAVDPVIRRASEADIPVIAAFDRKSNPDSAYRPEWLSGQLEDLLVAEIISPPRLDGRLPWFPRAAMRALGLAPRGPALAGYLLGMVLEEWEPRAALVRDVIVAEEMRRRGIGERLDVEVGRAQVHPRFAAIRRVEIWKRRRDERRVEQKAALLEHAGGGVMLRVAQREEARDFEGVRERRHRGEGLGRVTMAPRVARQHVPG